MDFSNLKIIIFSIAKTIYTLHLSIMGHDLRLIEIMKRFLNRNFRIKDKGLNNLIFAKTN